MVLKKLLCVIGVMAIFSHVHCMVAQYERQVTCKQCDRAIPTMPVKEEDLFHLDHADPCILEIDFRIGDEDPPGGFGLTRCNALIYLYQKSALHKRAKHSKCEGAGLQGCVGNPEKGPTLTCMVHLPRIKGVRALSSWAPLAWCVQQDLESWWSPEGGAHDTLDTRPLNQKLMDLVRTDVSRDSPIKQRSGSGKHFWNRLKSGGARGGQSILTWCSGSFRKLRKSRKSKKSRELRKSVGSSSSPSLAFSSSLG